MPITREHSTDVGVRPEVAFALLDDLPRTKEWLPPCTSLEKVTPGPNVVGDQLRYAFKQGGSTGTMKGEIRTYVPNERLECLYTDPKFDVLVDFRIESAPGGSTLKHFISIEPKTFLGRMMAPCIRLGLRGQTRKAMENIKTILEKQS
jgi:Polyketide cyclase / dehydrase and lipid transport